MPYRVTFQKIAFEILNSFFFNFLHFPAASVIHNIAILYVCITDIMLEVARKIVFCIIF